MVSTLVFFSGSTCQPCLANLDGPQLQLLYQGWSLSLGSPPQPLPGLASLSMKALCPCHTHTLGNLLDLPAP